MPSHRVPSISSSGLEQQLAHQDGIRSFRNEPLSKHTSMGVGGPADWFIEIDQKAALGPALKSVKDAGLPVLILGGGSNTLFGEEGYRGAILHLGQEFRSISPGPDPHTLTAGSAAILSAITKYAQKQGLSGMEFGIGIPGTLGGALAGNAGAGGEDICSITGNVQVLSSSMTIQTLQRGSFEYNYRFSALKGQIILGATLELKPASAGEIKAGIDRHLSKRWEQPLGERSSGCMFKNPQTGFAGELIERVGLKGLKIGGVRVSEKHANFMINDGSASAGDIEALITMVRTRVMEETGVTLETEVRLIDPSPA